MNTQPDQRRRRQDSPPELETTTTKGDDGTELTILYNPENQDAFLAAQPKLFIDLSGGAD